MFHRQSLWRYDCLWESLRQTRPKPLPQEPCPLTRGCRSGQRSNPLIETGAGVPGTGPCTDCKFSPAPDAPSPVSFARNTVLGRLLSMARPEVGIVDGSGDHQQSGLCPKGPARTQISALTRSGKVAGKVLKLDLNARHAKLLITLNSVPEWLRSRASNHPLGAPFSRFMDHGS